MNYNLKINVEFEDHITAERAKQIMHGLSIDLESTKAVKSVSPANNQFDLIRDWAREKGILDKGDAKTQTVKLAEELGELAAAVLRNKKTDAIDAIGDCVVVLTSLAYHVGMPIEQCIDHAYKVIAQRSGKMVDGDFQKDGSATKEVGHG